jgi:hypothetical protein
MLESESPAERVAHGVQDFDGFRRDVLAYSISGDDRNPHEASLDNIKRLFKLATVTARQLDQIDVFAPET